MSDEVKIIDERLRRLADESGLAIAIVDEAGRQVDAVNNNSICRHLNPADEFSPACARFCGRAIEKAFEAGRMIGFECHAGLDCHAIPVRAADKPFVAIVGRTFLKSENYRRATERAIDGDWSGFSPAELFENVLLTGSTDALAKTAEQVNHVLTEPGSQRDLQAQTEQVPETGTESSNSADDQREAVEEIDETVAKEEPETAAPKIEKRGKRTAEARAWRSFFGSILKTDYDKASASLLEFLSYQYGLSALLWLERMESRFENTATFGEMEGRRVRLGISPDDDRLAEAYRNESSLELSERPRESNGDVARVMNLFPIGVGGDISASVAVLDPIDPDRKKQISRICQSIAPQLEILRLRNEVAGREAVANAVRKFGDSLKSIDADDFWQDMAQNAAEMMRAERASLLLMDEKNGQFKIKALVGAKNKPSEGEAVGERVAKAVYDKSEPVVVADIARTGLPPAPPDRGYRTPSFLSSPVRIGERTIGVMSFADVASGEAFDKRSLELFQAVAPQLAVAIDRAALKEKAGEFEQLSVTDALTGLLNRRYMEERLTEEVKRSSRHGFPMSFMMLDVDHFKSYNDQFGHPAGDIALKIVAHVIRETLRGADVAARFGGEEFSILLPQTTGEEAVAIAERIRGNIEHADFPHRIVTTSIGVASCSAELCASADIVSAADKALYEAKRHGRNRVRTFQQMNGTRAE